MPSARASSALCLFLLLLFTLGLGACRGAAYDAPRAQDGTLDLSAWNFEHGSVRLDGEWRFVPNQLLEPHELEAASSVSLEVPGDWNELETPTGPMQARARGTYHLTVLLPPDAPELSMRVRRVATAHRLWIDGQERPGGGVVSDTLDETVERMPNRLHTLPHGAKRVELVVQVANLEHRAGGIRKAWLLGPSEAIQTEHGGWIVFDAIVLALMMAVGGHYLLLFLVRRKGDFHLYFALMVLGVGIRSASAGNGALVTLLFPTVSFAAMLRLEYCLSWACIVFGLEMVHRLFPEEGIPWVKWPLQLGATLMFAFTLLSSPSRFTGAIALFQLTAVLGVLLTIVTIFRAIFARREGARSLMATVMLVAAAIIHDVALAQGMVRTPFELAAPAFVALIVLEAGMLARSFARSFTLVERLSDELKASNRDLRATNQAVERFVPFEFLEMLERSSIRDVARGDFTNLTMDVLFCDIRSFTTIAEAIDPQRTFAFINDYLRHMEPPVHAHDGFIDSYQGDGILALFYGGPDRAVSAAVGMLRALDRFNEVQDYVSDHTIRIGIGLHGGELMLGTIGGLDRLDNSVVGDPVNLASRIEGMTKKYGTPLIISGVVMERLEQPGDFKIRELDRVIAKGKTEAMDIYEVLDGLPTAQREARWARREDFAAGVAHYRAGEFQAAAQAFERCLDSEFDDPPARVYLERCRAYDKQPPHEWRGLTVLTSK